MEVLTLGAFLRLPMTFKPPIRGNERVGSGGVAGMRVDDSVRGARICGFGEAWWCRVAWEGACNHRRHDDARSLHLKLVLMKFDCFFRQIENCSERRLSEESVRVRKCARRTRDSSTTAESADFTLFIAARRWRLQRLRKSFSFFAIGFGTSFGAAGRGAITAGVAVRSTIRGSPGQEALDAEARRAMISSDSKAGDGGGWR